jgi:hypothetical protein
MAGKEKITSRYIVRPKEEGLTTPKPFHWGEIIEYLAPHQGGDGLLHDGTMRVVRITGYMSNRNYLQARLKCTVDGCEESVTGTAVLGDTRIELTPEEAAMVDVFTNLAIETYQKRCCINNKSIFYRMFKQLG